VHLVLYKNGGADNAYKEELTRIPQTLKYALPRQLEAGPRRPLPTTARWAATTACAAVLEMVCAAVRD